LILHMGSAPSTWGTDNLPPSMSDVISPLCPDVRPGSTESSKIVD
jgi:hypothetical protein